MKLSADKKSKYYDKNRVKCVYLDGIEVEAPVEADVEEGWVLCIRKDWSERHKQDLPIEEKLYGKVEITFRPEVEVVTNEIETLTLDIASNLFFLEKEVDKLKKLNKVED